jgi:predicted nucleic acid-binding protein
MVVQAAINSGAERLYSEDLNNGQRFGALQILNPFATQGVRARSTKR